MREMWVLTNVDYPNYIVKASFNEKWMTAYWEIEYHSSPNYKITHYTAAKP